MAGGIRIEDGDVRAALARLDRLDVSDAVTATAFSLGRRAKVLAPFRTGSLHDSLRVETRGTSATVGFNAEHAPHVEYGHRQNVGQYVPSLGKRLKAPYVPGQHFLARATDEERPDFERRIRGLLEEAV